jgi:hypothetical protein
LQQLIKKCIKPPATKLFVLYFLKPIIQKYRAIADRFFLTTIFRRENLGAFFAPQKTGLCGGSVTPSIKSHALHGFYAWRDRYAPLQSLAHEPGAASLSAFWCAGPRCTGYL